MKDDMLADEHQVTLDLVIELVRYFHAAHVVWAWFGPLPADFACLHHFGDKVQDLI